ncbi:DUF2515 family protein [Ornithinibacillus scapharcae]|uniref:DUF2515 family protein n=1 Tax=Ornithinibacillus scapharcae TaxID=1147159 RepID=UPI000225BA11|nr:DUF2515 family protein [Ornithinibacillus scapharcae]
MYWCWNNRDYIHYIINKTNKHNIDNISRTIAYQQFYLKYPEIKWALLASVVSRNAGWNMTDLHLPAYKNMLGEAERKQLFMTYERANWLIFSDAYPQLLVYELSTKNGKPLYHLLQDFHVSSFMIREWENFHQFKDTLRLMIALIINEQNLIQRPVISQPFFKREVFLSIPYILQNTLMLNAVILPTKENGLYGAFVHGFTTVANRIDLGKSLASQLFHPEIYNHIMNFLLGVEHTGSRYDYERYYSINFPKNPLLRTVYPIIEHQDNIRSDWYELGGIKQKWMRMEEVKPNPIGNHFYQKRKWLMTYHQIKKLFT